MNNAECWTAALSARGLESSSSIKTGGGPGGGGGQGALGAGGVSKREAGAIGPCETRETKVRVTFNFIFLAFIEEKNPYVFKGDPLQ